MKSLSGAPTRGFVLVEAAAALAAVVALAAILTVLAPRSRTNAWQAESLANLRQFGAVTGAFGADHTDLFWSFSWPTGIAPTDYPDLRGPWYYPVEAAAAQATDIIRRRGGRGTDVSLQLDPWIPHAFYSHLVLADYLGVELPMWVGLSPGDATFRRWASDPALFDSGGMSPVPSDAMTRLGTRWPYRSSYLYPSVFYSRDYPTPDMGIIFVAGEKESTSYVGLTGAGPLGDRRISQATYPSHKIQMFERAQFQVGKRDVFFVYPYARVATLLVDGSAAVRVTSSVNLGWRPDNPTNLLSTTYTYNPEAWEPPAQPGSSVVPGRQQFTRSGLRGRDVEAREVPFSP